MSKYCRIYPLRALLAYLLFAFLPQLPLANIANAQKWQPSHMSGSGITSAQSGYLYGISDTNQLIKIDLGNNLQETVIGTLPIPNVWGLAYDPSSNLAYGLTTDGKLLSIGLTTASAQLIQTLSVSGSSFFGGFEFATIGGVKTLFVYTLLGNRQVLRINLVGAAPYPVTIIGGGDQIRQITDLAFESQSGIMFAMDALQQRIGTVNVTNGAFTPQINNTNIGINNPVGLALDSTGILYGDHAQPNLVTYSFVTGLATHVQSTAATKGLMFVPALPPPTPTPTATPTATPTIPCTIRDTGDVTNGGFELNNTSGWNLDFKTCGGFSPAACLNNNIGWQSTPPSGHPGAKVIDQTATITAGSTQVVPVPPFEGNFMVQINDLAGGNHTTRIQQEFSLQNVHPTCGYLRFKWRSLLDDANHPSRQKPKFEIELEQKRNVAGWKTITNESFVAGASDPNWTKISGTDVFDSTQSYETNLFDYSNSDRLRLSMRVRDCSEGGHGGVAFLDGLQVVDWCSPTACSGLYGAILDKLVIQPNTFTPDNDGLNDTYDITSQADFCSILMTVFNRWGSIVYEKLIGNSGSYFPNGNKVTLWDGKENQKKRGKKGELVPDGTYVSKLTLYNCSGSYQLTPTNVTVLGGNCKPTPVVSDTKCNRSKNLADFAADTDWRRKVRKLYGSGWANLGHAANKQTTCNKNGKKYCCSVSARPCR